MKRILSLVLSFTMLVTAACSVPFSANAATSGSCGENAKYTYDLSKGTLVISGSGAISDYSAGNKAPWNNSDCINNLKTLTIDSGITKIGNCAFQQLTQLNSIMISNTVKIIGERAFDNCAVGAIPMALSIPESVEQIGYNAFRGMSKVTAFSVSTANKYFSSVEGVLYNKDCTTLIQSPCRLGVTALNIPSSVTTIQANAFYKSLTLEHIYVPLSITTVGDGMTSVFTSSSSSLTVHYPEGSEFDWNIYLKNNNINAVCYRPGACMDAISDYVTEVKNPTCTEQGYTLHTCPVCSFSYKDNYVDATQHSYDERVVEPTEELSGYTEHTCSKCGDVYRDNPVPPLEPVHNHSFEIEAKKDPSCTKPGLISYVCECGERNIKNIPPLGHSYDDGVITTPPTCVQSGVMTYTCSRCDDKLTQIIDKLGHCYDDGVVAVPPTCTQLGEKLFTCENCGGTYTENIELKAHSYATTKATLTKNGAVKCKDCGNVKSTIYAPKTFTMATTAVYNGKVKTPAVTVKDSKGKTLVKGTDYTVSYASGRKNVGKYAVKITFKGNYSGSKTLYFTIKPKNTSISGITAGSKKFTVKIKKYTTQTTGYQIQYATNTKFTKAKTVTVSNKTTSKTISKLASKKKYYVRIRTYKTVGGTKYYSAWSKYKAVTTKK